MSESQRLRWWQEENHASQSAQEASKRLAVSATSVGPENIPVSVRSSEAASTEEELDTWAELEAEALRRSLQIKNEEAESISFCLDTSIALRQNRRSVWDSVLTSSGAIILIFAIQIAVVKLAPDYSRYVLSPAGFGGVLAGAIVRGIRRGKWLRELDEPVLRFSSDGLHLNTLDHPNVTLPWDEVVSVTSKSILKSRYLEVRGTKKRQRFYISEQDLPLPPDIIAAHVAVYETGR
jgi:hypothetical protein